MSARALLTSLLLASVAAVFGACMLGSTPMTPARVFATLAGQGTVADSVVVWQIRLPRALAAFVVGVALGASGAALQVCYVTRWRSLAYLGLRPPRHSPRRSPCTTVLPRTQPICCRCLPSVALWPQPLCLHWPPPRIQSVVTLILLGVGLSSFAGAAMSLLLNLAPNPFSLADMINWLLGSVANRSFDDLVICVPFIAIGLAVLLVSRRGLSALTLGEEAAAGVGLNLRRLRIAVVIGTGIATGGSVALAGAIGFVGIITPHIVRPFVHHDPARSVLPSALLAGLLLVLADIGVRVLPTTSELKLGVVVALLGAPIFVWIALQRGATHD